MVLFTVAFKEEFWRRYNEECQRPAQIMQALGFDVDVLGDRRISGILLHIREQVESGEGFRDVRKIPEGQATIYEQLPPSKAIPKIQHKVAYLEQEMEFIKKYNCGQRSEAEKVIKTIPEVKFGIIKEMTT